MQDPLQRPTNQPSYAPAEMFGQEQVQIYAPPARDITQPLMLAQEISIYPNRTKTIWRTIVIVVALFIVLLLFIPFTFFTLSNINDALQGNTIMSSFIPIIIILFILFLAQLAYISRAAWRMASALLFSRKPLLVINREGIKVSWMPSLRSFFIPWAEVEALSSCKYMYKYLCIHPRNQKKFMKRFSWWERFASLTNSTFGVPPLGIPQVFLERPVEEILSTLYYTYANELAYYHVQLRP